MILYPNTNDVKKLKLILNKFFVQLKHKSLIIYKKNGIKNKKF